MKARVIATGYIVDVKLSHYIDDVAWYITTCHASYSENELEFIDGPQDYWTRLEHTYAGMAMQGILMNEKMQEDLYKAFGKNESMDVTISEFAIDIANTLIQKLKEKEERK